MLSSPETPGISPDTPGLNPETPDFHPDSPDLKLYITCFGSCDYSQMLLHHFLSLPLSLTSSPPP